MKRVRNQRFTSREVPHYPFHDRKAKIASVAICIYVSIRFEWRFAIAAIIAILHDAFVVIAVFAISIVVKEGMFQYKYRLGKKLPSQELIAYAWERRSDMYASVAALVGVLGAILGNYSGYAYLYYLDPLAGLFIAVLVLRMGCRLAMGSIHNQLEHTLHEEDAKALIQTVQTIKGVIAVDELRAKEHGHYVLVDVKISVNPRISVQEGHEIARLAKQALMKRFHHVSDVFIHVNPYDPGYPYKNNSDSDPDHYPTLLH